MNDVDQRMDLPTISQHIDEFRMLAGKAGSGVTSRRNPARMRFLAKGAYLSALRVVLYQRLEEGWTYLNNDPTNTATADFWFGLLERYETICDLLQEYGTPDMAEEAARIIFKGEDVDERPNV